METWKDYTNTTGDKAQAHHSHRKETNIEGGIEKDNMHTRKRERQEECITGSASCSLLLRVV